MIWHTYGAARPGIFTVNPVKMFLWTNIIVALFLIVATRFHYTLDVILAVYFTITIWGAYHRAADDVLIGHRFVAVWIVDGLIIYPLIGWMEAPHLGEAARAGMVSSNVHLIADPAVASASDPRRESHKIGGSTHGSPSLPALMGLARPLGPVEGAGSIPSLSLPDGRPVAPLAIPAPDAPLGYATGAAIPAFQRTGSPAIASIGADGAGVAGGSAAYSTLGAVSTEALSRLAGITIPPGYTPIIALQPRAVFGADGGLMSLPMFFPPPPAAGDPASGSGAVTPGSGRFSFPGASAGAGAFPLSSALAAPSALSAREDPAGKESSESSEVFRRIAAVVTRAIQTALPLGGEAQSAAKPKTKAHHPGPAARSRSSSGNGEAWTVGPFSGAAISSPSASAAAEGGFSSVSSSDMGLRSPQRRRRNSAVLGASIESAAVPVSQRKAVESPTSGKDRRSGRGKRSD
jgi:hypothetical protein